MPTTSIAGDCANAVTEAGEWSDDDSERRAKGILCMQVLTQTFHRVILTGTLLYALGTNIPQLQTSVVAPDQDFVQVSGGV
jgi:hypothetical protein